jgi:hypothetical protein
MTRLALQLEVQDYSEHALSHGAGAKAAAYVECRTADGKAVWGVGIDEDIATASVRAVLSAAKWGSWAKQVVAGLDKASEPFTVTNCSRRA